MYLLNLLENFLFCHLLTLNELVELNRLFLKNWTLFINLCNKIKKQTKSGVDQFGFCETEFWIYFSWAVFGSIQIFANYINK